MGKSYKPLILLSAAWLGLGCGSNNGATSAPPGTVALTSISPTQTTVSTSALTVRGLGAGFTTNSSLRWNGSQLATQFVTSSEIDATIPPSDLAVPGSNAISVTDPSESTSGSAQIFTVTAVSVGNVQRLVSVAPDGSACNSNSGPVNISADGRFVAFTSFASNLATGSSASFANVYLRDTCTGVSTGCVVKTVLISGGVSGSVANGNSGENSGQVSSLAVSSDGRYVAFESDASNLVSTGVTATGNIFVRDTCNGAVNCSPSTTIASVSSGGIQADGPSLNPAMSGDGRYVVFQSQASNLVSGLTTSVQQIYLRDTCTGSAVSCTASTTLVSYGNPGLPGNGLSSEAAISGDGRFVSFTSQSTNLLPGTSGNAITQIYIRDLCANNSGCKPTTALVSQANNGQTGGNAGSSESSISGNGRFVAFSTGASNIVPGGNLASIAVRDTCFGVAACSPSTIAISSPSTPSVNATPSISTDGSLVAFYSGTSGGSGIAEAYVSRVCPPTSPTCIPATVEVSTGFGGAAANFNIGLLSLAGSGHWIVFSSGATNLVPTPTNGKAQTYFATTTF
jgi:hypothetical protein